MTRRPTITRAHLLFVTLAIVYTVGIALALAILVPAEAHATDTPVIAAHVNQRPILRTAVDTIARQLASNGREASDEQILDELINLEVLAEAAEAEKLDREDHVAAALHLQYTQTLANAYLADLEQSLAIDEATLRDAYAQSTAGPRALEFRAAHILLASEAEARDVIARLQAGGTFATLARTESIDSTATQGGDLGWVDATTLPGSLGEAVASLAIGESSPLPLESPFGWHVLTLLDTRSAAHPPFSALRGQLRDRLVQQELSERVAALRAEADVQRPRVSR